MNPRTWAVVLALSAVLAACKGTPNSSPLSVPFEEQGQALVAKGSTLGLEVQASGTVRLRVGQNLGLTLSTESISRGPHEFKDASVLRKGDGAAQLVGAVATEEWRLTAKDAEQRWRFETEPKGTGDLVFRVRADGVETAQLAPAGLSWQPPSAAHRFTYSHGTWVDANGTRTPVPVTLERSMIVLRVPAALLAQTQWPAVLDPTLSIDTELAASWSRSTEPMRRQSNPTAAVLGTKMLVAWQDERFEQNRPSIFATWFDTVNASLVSRFRLTNGTESATSVAVAAASQRFLVVWASGNAQDSNIGGAWVTSATGVIESRFVVSALATIEDSPTVACDAAVPAVCFVAYRASASAGGINVTRLTEGATSGTSGEAVQANSNIQYPSLVWNGTAFVLAWHDLRVSGTPDISGISFAGTSIPSSVAGTLLLVAPPPPGGRYVPLLIPGPSGQALLVWQQFGPVYYAMRLNGLSRVDANPIQVFSASGVSSTPSGYYSSNQYNLYAYSSTGGIVRRQITNGTLGSEISITSTPRVIGPLTATLNSTSEPSSYSFVWEESGTGGNESNIDRWNSANTGPTIALSVEEIEQSRVSAADGQALAVYITHHEQGDGGYNLGWSLFTADAGLLSDFIWVQPGLERMPAVGTRPGRSLVAWLPSTDCRSGMSVKATLVDHANPTTPGPVLSLGDNSACSSPEVIPLANEYLVLWQAGFGSGTGKITRIGPAGEYDGGQSTLGPSNLLSLKGTPGPNEKALVVATAGNIPPYGVQFTVVNNSGIGPSFTPLSAQVPGAGRDQVAVDSDGTNYLVAWVDSRNLVTTDNDVYAARVNADGTLIDSNPRALDRSLAKTTAIALSWNGYQHVLAMENEYLDGGRHIELQWLRPDLSVAYDSGLYSGETVKEPSLAHLGPGRTLLSWTQSRLGASIAANRVYTSVLQVDVGDTCLGGTDCPSGFCVQGVCCNSACGGVCETCLAAQGASRDGLCAPRPSSVVCRAAGGLCDAIENCDGVASTCPADAIAPDTEVCRATQGPCDVEEKCDGASKICPVVDVLRPSGSVCQNSTLLCTGSATCSGTDISCPAGLLHPDGYACRPAVGDCDIAESCNGTDPSCPADAFSGPEVRCRDSFGACDVEENCTGNAPACPLDTFLPETVVCRSAQVGSACDRTERCTGSQKDCPADQFFGPEQVCRGVQNGNSCDAIEVCSGQSADCPADTAVADGQTCENENVCRAGACIKRASQYGWGCTGSPSDVALWLAILIVYVLSSRNRKAFPLLAIALVSIESAHAASSRPTLALIGIRNGTGASEEAAATLVDVLQSELASLNAFNVMSSSDIGALIGIERQKQLLGCANDAVSCTAELAGALDASLAVTGDLAKVDDSWVLNLSLLDVRSSSPIARVGRKVEGKLSSLLDEVRPLVYELVNADPARKDNPLVMDSGFRGFTLGIRADVDALGLAVSPGISAEYATRYLGGSLTVLPKPNPGARLEGRFYPFASAVARPHIALGVSGFVGGLALRGALGITVRYGHLQFFADAGYEHFVIKQLEFLSQAVLVGAGIGWNF